MIRLVLALVTLVGLMWLASWLGKATPAQRSKALKMILLYGVAGMLLLLVVTGSDLGSCSIALELCESP